MLIATMKYCCTMFVVCGFSLLVILNWNSASGASITYVTPRRGSFGGETKLVIFGKDLAAEQFSDTNDPNVGTTIVLVSESDTQWPCRLHLDGCTRHQMTCYTPPGMPDQEYYVNAIVDGEALGPEDRCNGHPTAPECTYRPVSWRTPKLYEITPQSGQPGGFVTMRGKIYTDRYGTGGGLDETGVAETATNGRVERLLRVYVGVKECEMRDGDIPYGLELDNDESDDGYITCKTLGESVGYYRLSIIVESPFGRNTFAPEVDRISRTGLRYLYQMYTEITGLSVHSGSREGGLKLRIFGQYYSDKAPYTPAQAFVDETVCAITVVEDDFVDCIVEPDPQRNSDIYPGNRGIIHECWDGVTKTAADVDDVLTLTSADPGYRSGYLDETNFVDSVGGTDYVCRLTTFFSPPEDGTYMFSLTADDGAKLFVDGQEEVASQYGRRNSRRMELSMNTKYLLEAVHYQGSGGASIHISAKHFGSKFTETVTGKADMEELAFVISSTVHEEIQELVFSGFSSQNETNEIQTVNVDSADEFRFGLFGAYTGPLTVDMDESDAETAINSLPCFDEGEYVFAKFPDSFEGTGVGFEFRFESKRGDFPMVDVVPVTSGSTVNVAATEDVRGETDMNTVAIEFGGVISPSFSLIDLTPEKLEAKLDAMFGARCPEALEGSLNGKVYLSFEEDGDNYIGTRTKESEPFCGRYTLKNPELIFTITENQRAISLTSNNKLCFAYKGFLVDSLWLRYKSKSLDENEVTSSEIEYPDMGFLNDSAAESNTWYYTCVDMLDLAMSSSPLDVNHQLESVWVKQRAAEEDIFVDSVFIGSEVTTDHPESVNLMRMRPSMPDGIMIDSVTVESTQPDVYTVTIIPFECGYNLPIMHLAAGTTSGVTSPVTSTLSHGGSLTTTRLQAASPPVTGTFDATYFNGNSKTGLPVQAKAPAFQMELESLEGIGNLYVERSEGCANFDYKVKFIDTPGDIPDMTVVSHLNGIDADVSVFNIMDGGLNYDPLTGETLHTVKDKPQVRLYINDVPTICNGDCSFEWTDEATPSVTGVTPDTAMPGTSIEIAGLGFSETLTGNEVVIGDKACNVTAATAELITCQLGIGPTGRHKVMVNVEDKGNVIHPSSGDIVFNYKAGIDSVSPTTGSLGGGGVLSVRGYGFTTDGFVTIANAICALIDVSPDHIKCLIPHSATAGTFDVTVTQGSEVLTYTGYFYDESLTTILSDVTPTALGVQGGRITILGTFSEPIEHVFVGDVEAVFTMPQPNQIEADVPAIDPGVHDLRVMTLNGVAVDSNNVVPKITFSLSIDAVSPTSGSMNGGTKLTITGSGFGTDRSIVAVTVGRTACEIITLTDSKIVCQIGHTGQEHRITNRGIHPVYGENYAFDIPYMTIPEGDGILWEWYTPSFINGVAHSIIEVPSPSETEEKKVGGFSSGVPSANGHYRHQFTTRGTYTISSGNVDTYGIKKYVGQIKVIARESSSGEVSVKVAGKEAVHNVLSGVANPPDVSTCQTITSPKTDCVDASLTPIDVNKFTFFYSTCHTPIVSAIDQQSGTVETVVTLSGEGFSTKPCQNEVSMGEFAFETTSSTDTYILCNLAPFGSPNLAASYQISLYVANLGYAMTNIKSVEDASFRVLPSVRSVSPRSGSLAGGTRLQIVGFGFGDAATVSVGGLDCQMTSQSYTEIVCDTPPSTTQDMKVIEVKAYVGVIPQTAECDENVCEFGYLRKLTPTLANIKPTSASRDATFTITGNNFGSDASAVHVYIGDAMATIVSVTKPTITAFMESVPVGLNSVTVMVDPAGMADGRGEVTGEPLLISVVPDEGSIHGQTRLTIQGSGFPEDTTNVTIGGAVCTVESVTLSQVTCITSAHADGEVVVEVTANGIRYPDGAYTYNAASTPTIDSVAPTVGLPGDELTISGSNFGSDYPNVSVRLGDVACVVLSTSTDTTLKCTVGDHATGTVDVAVHIAGVGDANTGVMFAYELDVTNVMPTTGGTAGGQLIEVTGVGFGGDTTSVTLCGQDCTIVELTSTSVTCKTPPNTDQTTCDVVVTCNGLTETLAGAYTYDGSLTPSVTSVSPGRGGTGGGTRLTVTGTGFGTIPEEVTVTIDGSECAVESVIDTTIECRTGPHPGSRESSVNVEINHNGLAESATPGAADYMYIDVWSSVYTWGGDSLPAEGDFVVIPKGMTLLLDTDTPILAYLLIKGGKLIFDEKDIELQAKNIMVTDGGSFRVGTEEEPFQHKATITLHGHAREREQPVYGSKVLAVRNGTLEMFGIPTVRTWTHLANTVEAGATDIELQEYVDWNEGDEIVIATTGNHLSQGESEKKTIAGVSGDGLVLSLDSPLEFRHLGTEEMFDDRLVQFRAEVGLLSHNIKVRGNDDPSYHDEIEKCDQDFDPGEFAVQTCFQGKFGDEIGSSEHGGQILIHGVEYEAEARISDVEVTFAGQSNRLGRYPVHLHMNGDSSTSYIRRLAIHKTFNRAVNLHGTHNTLVEHTVVYDIKGGAFFLEDGIETGNTLQHNLAIFVRRSDSLLNDDITPAAFWLLNPDNIVQFNAAAGCTNNAFWYRMNPNPTGPSYTPSVCPVNDPLGVFRNNTAHSNGWFGLWVFEFYYPLVGGCGGTETQAARFESFFSYFNAKGAEAVNFGALQFHNFTLVQNAFANFQGKKISGAPLYTDEGPLISDSLIAGWTTAAAGDDTIAKTAEGITLPHGEGFQIKRTTFANFDTDGSTVFGWNRLQCPVTCGGYIYHSDGLKFINADRMTTYDWEWEGIIIDTDGTATGFPGYSVLPSSGTLPLSCIDAPPGFSLKLPASICPPDVRFHRAAFNEIDPLTMEGKDYIIFNEFGNSSVPFAKKRSSHPMGWVFDFVDGQSYNVHFKNAEYLVNISFNAGYDDYQGDDYSIINWHSEGLPDRVSIDGGNNFIDPTVGGLDPSVANNGDWSYDQSERKFNFFVGARKRSTRAADSLDVNRNMRLKVQKCDYTDCIPPPDPDTLPPATERPADFIYYNESQWDMANDSYVENVALSGSYGLPHDGDDVRITADTWVVARGSEYHFGTLFVAGVLEVDDVGDCAIDATYIIIMGGRLIIGWPDNPFDGLAEIVLRGDSSSPVFIVDGADGPNIGAMAIGVFGGLDLFGQDVGVAWTQLAVTADAGSSQITLADEVTWSAGDQLTIGPTSYTPSEAEIVTIASTDGTTLTLESPLMHKHIAHYETLDLKLAATVGKLTRNIKVMGEDNGEAFGARVLAGLYDSKDRTYTGYVRASNVEFMRMGQPYFTKKSDPRITLAFLNTGPVRPSQPSLVKDNSFHDLYSTAVGVFGTGSLNVSGNVVSGVVGNGFVIDANDTYLVGNLINGAFWTGTTGNNFEKYNFNWEAGVEALSATFLTMQDNIVAGAERFAYHVNPLPCDDTSGRYSNNGAFSSHIAVGIFPDDILENEDCAMINGYVAWKSVDFGLYYQNGLSLKIDDNVFVENQQGVFPRVNKPLSDRTDSTISVTNSVFVGTTASFDCANDVPTDDDNYKLSSLARPGLAPTGGMIGLTFPNFMSGSNGTPKKPFKNDKKEPSIKGLMTASDLTFVGYGSSCRGDFAIGTNAGNHDAQHMIQSKSISLIDVEEGSKIIYHRPFVSKINAADCVDMDCDAMKKALFIDMDGSFLGAPGSVIPESEWEWDGDKRRGLGDYRIPDEMVTDLEGNRIEYSTLMPNKGIIRDESCELQAAWNAYKCGNSLNYTLLVIESLDDDTMTRRLSPVAVLGRGYVDLINGPQDHGCCSGYGCRRRISNFYSIVATDEEYTIYFTGTNAENMRYQLLNVDDTRGVKLNVWYSRPNRLDVYVAGDNAAEEFIYPTNRKIIPGKPDGLHMPTGDEFQPLLSDPTGSNFMDYHSGIISFILKGADTYVEIRTEEVVFVSFSLPFMTEAEFYGENAVENIAAFFDIPPSKVRVVSITANTGGGTRRKRAATGIEVSVELGDEPNSNSTMDRETLVDLAAALTNECQAGNVSALLNATAVCDDVVLPPELGSVDVITYSTPVVDRLTFTRGVTASREGQPFTQQPLLQVFDSANEVVRQLGTKEHPWQMTVSIRVGTGHLNATLGGTTNVTATNGWFHYTDLSISHMGHGYILEFAVFYPEVASNFIISTPPFDVTGRPVKTNVVAMTTSKLFRNSTFFMKLDLKDSDNDDTIADIGWRDHSWDAEAQLLGSPKYGSLAGTLDTVFDPGNGQALFPDLSITGFGIFYIRFRVWSTPPDFNFTYNYKLNIENPQHENMVPEGEYEIEAKFDEDYNSILSTTDKENEFEQMIFQEYANKWSNVRMKSGSIGRGSIVVTFVIDGSVADINSTAYSLCDSIHEDTQYTFGGQTLTLSPYLTVNGEAYYGVTCGEIESDDDDDEDDDDDGGKALKPYLIAIIAVLGVIVVAGVGVVIWWCCVVKPHSQTHDLVANEHFRTRHLAPPDFKFREETFTSMKFRQPSPRPMPPSSTRFGATPPILEAYGPSKLPMYANRLTPLSVSKVEVTEPPRSAASHISGSGLYDEPDDKRTPSPSRFNQILTLHGEKS